MKNISFTIATTIVVIIPIFAQSVYDNSWHLIGTQFEDIRPIAIHPENEEVIYLGTGSDFTNKTLGGLFKSNDGGNSWDTLVYPISPIDIVIDDKHPDTIYVTLGTANATTPGILKTIDAGETWFWADSGIYLDWETSVGSIAIHPLNRDTLFAGTFGFFAGTIYCSYNGGSNWFRCDSNLYDYAGNAWNIVIPKFSPNTIYVSMHWPISIWKSTDLGLTWINILYYDQDPTQKSITISYNRDIDTLYTLYCYYDGLKHSLNEGENWETVIPDSISVSHAVVNQYNQDELFANVGYSPEQPHKITAVTISDTNYFFRTCGTGLPFGTSAKDLVYHQKSKKLFASSRYGLFYINLDTVELSIFNRNIIPNKYKILSAYPNPFNSKINIIWEAGTTGTHEIVIYDILGKKITTVSSGSHKEGKLMSQWDGLGINNKPVSSGVYVAKLYWDDLYSSGRCTVKILFLK